MRARELRQHEEALGFPPQDPVQWLSPAELWRAGVKVVLSSVFASYADKREIQATLDTSREPLSAPRTAPDDPWWDGGAGDPRDDEIWLDFVADLGDGFDATYTVASLLACPKLDVAPGPDGHVSGPLERASLLVLGGDEVYPTASARDYENRMKGPYRAALPEADDEPLMVVIPGNHDWYDGLTSFLRTFTQERNIGGWRTAQKRSYFAVRLPHRWWLLGLDTQFGTELDEPQLQYFEREVSQRLQEGDSVILCAATPSWVHSTEPDRVDAFNSLHWFDRQYIRTRPRRPGAPPGTDDRVPTGASVRLWITGDSHHYARFAECLESDDCEGSTDTPAEEAGRTPSLPADPRRRQMVTCGLGGAYLSATHRLPEDLRLPPDKARVRHRDEQLHFARAEVCYPDRSTSARWARRLAVPWSRYWLPRRNPGFALLAAGVHVALLLGLSLLLGLTTGQSPVSAIRTATVGDALGLLARTSGAVAAVLLGGLLAQLSRRRRPVSGTAVVGVLAQLLVAGAVLVTAVAVVPPGARWWAVVLLCSLGAAVVGATLGSEAFAASVLLARSGEAFGWQMSGQAVEDGKGFVRMHIDADGLLTLYPLVVDEVCHDWALDPDPATHPEATTRRPVPARSLPVPRLIEPPIEIAPTGGRA
jgi:hypothetical protein